MSKLLWTGALSIYGFYTLLKGTLAMLRKCHILLIMLMLVMIWSVCSAAMLHYCILKVFIYCVYQYNVWMFEAMCQFHAAQSAFLIMKCYTILITESCIQGYYFAAHLYHITSTHEALLPKNVRFRSFICLFLHFQQC